MEINWHVTEKDILNVQSLIAKNQNPFVENRISKNVKKIGIILDKDAFLKGMIMCLLTTQQRSGPNSLVAKFLLIKPFPITFTNVLESTNIENFVRETLFQNGLTRYINRISLFFAKNFQKLEKEKWKMLIKISEQINIQSTKESERHIADEIQQRISWAWP